MNPKSALYNLEKQNRALKSKLICEQLKSGNYSFAYFKKYSLIVLNEYKKHQSFFKTASIVGISQKEIMNWYIQGQRGNPLFRGFYLAICDINNNETDEKPVEKLPVAEEKIIQENIPEEGEYQISRYGDGWSYKTYVDGEKIFIISNELETLKKKVRDKHLPLD